MSTFTVAIEFPAELRELGYSESDIRDEAPVLLVLKRFRQGRISSSKAARLLRLSRRDLLDLLSREGIPIYGPPDEQFADELKTIDRLGHAQP